MRNYRDLRVWEDAHELTLSVYRVTQLFLKEERFGLTSQVRRFSSSIGANLAEGCGRRSDGEMARFVQIAMESGAELSCHLLLARDLGFLKNEEYASLSSAIDRIMKMLSALSGRSEIFRRHSRLEPKARSQGLKSCRAVTCCRCPIRASFGKRD
jgi:four helix bundle protein